MEIFSILLLYFVIGYVYALELSTDDNIYVLFFIKEMFWWIVALWPIIMLLYTIDYIKYHLKLWRLKKK